MRVKMVSHSAMRTASIRQKECTRGDGGIGKRAKFVDFVKNNFSDFLKSLTILT